MQYINDPTFKSYGNAGEVQVQSNGVLSDWFFSMFAASMDMAHSPFLLTAYVIALVAMVVLMGYFEQPIKGFGMAIVCGYSVIQTFTVFKASHYLVDYTSPGWFMTLKPFWFAILFTVIFVWGVSRALQYVVEIVMRTGIGGLVEKVNPLKMLDKFRASDKDLDDLEEGASAKNPKRQNTAIMFTDIVGYSAAMGKNEAAMVAKLDIHNQIMRNQIVRNRGTVIKTIGDAFMVRFRSAESAVQCAMDCQKAIKEYNKTKTEENDRFHIRIGVHMGEIIHTGTDVFGEGVNIAARIEPKADPDGICVSDVIANASRNKVPAHFSSLGRLPMKNIANPPELFKVFPLEQQEPAKVAKAPAAPAAGGKGAPAPAGKAAQPAASAPASGTPGGVFKI